MRKLYLIEGIPGSGKTTFAKMLASTLKEREENVTLYLEGDLHPADMAWSALLTEKEYQDVCTKYPQKRQEIEKNASIWNEKRIVGYAKIPEIDEQLRRYFESKEIYDGRVDASIFCGIHKQRWKEFGDNAEGITIFECALLQNAVNELLLFQGKEEAEITEYIKELVSQVGELEPVLIYLDVDTKSFIKRAAEERVDKNGNHVWEQGVSTYIEQSPYGRRKGFHGVEGMYEYFEQRKQMELRILKELPVKKHSIKLRIDTQEEIVWKWIASCNLNKI